MGLSLGIYNRKTSEWDRRFDSLRYSGDYDFHTWHCDPKTVVQECDPPLAQVCYGDEPVLYYRPRDFDASRQWVRDNIDPEWTDNIKRLMDALDWLEENPDLWFNGNW